MSGIKIEMLKSNNIEREMKPWQGARPTWRRLNRAVSAGKISVTEATEGGNRNKRLSTASRGAKT